MHSTWKNIRLILHREVRDQLRDRRTLFMVVILPLLLYPAMGLGTLYMAQAFTEQPRQVVILGADHLPEPALIEDGRFSDRWFAKEDTSSKLLVLTDSADKPSGRHLTRNERKSLLNYARKLSILLQRRNEIVRKIAPWSPDDIDELPGVEAAALRARILAGDVPEPPENLAELQDKLAALKRHIGDGFASCKFEVLLVIPEGFGAVVDDTTRLLANGASGDAFAELPMLRPVVARNGAANKSEVAYARVREALIKWEKEIQRDRLEQAALPEMGLDPVSVLGINVANQKEVAASMWSKMVPGLLVIMALTGAFYPAIDVAAGEKERGTMETLLICPATRSEIVIGKFLTVMLFSFGTTILNLVSIGFTGRYMVSFATGGVGSMAVSIPLPTPLAIFWMVILLVPLATFFSALCLALATFARSNKEGQYYLTPLFMLTIGLTMMSMSPTVELSTDNAQSLFYCAVPVVGPALLLKALLVNPGNTGILVFGLPVLMSSIGYGCIALWWAVEQFKSEDVLFREAEQFDLKLWLRSLFRDKLPLPTFGHAASCFILMLLLQFLSLGVLPAFMAGTAVEDIPARLQQLLVGQQLTMFALPAIAMALLFTSSARKTLRLKLPTGKLLALAVLLPVILHPLAIELLTSLHEFFPQLPESARRQMAIMQDETTPLLVTLAIFALTPALCEEIAFRGFILSGFGQGGRLGVAIVLSSLAFGIIHMIPQQVFNASLLGLVLGLLAIRSGSLLPGIVFHLIFNSLAVLHGQGTAHLIEAKPDWLSSDIVRWLLLVDLENDSIRYNFLPLVVCAVIAFFAIRGLIRMPQQNVAEENDAQVSSLPDVAASTV